MLNDDGINAVSHSAAPCANSDWVSVPHSAKADLDGATVLGPQRRNRRWDAREKARITAESFEPGANISAIAAFFLIYCLPYVVGLVTVLCLRIALAPYWALAIVPIGVVILLVVELYLIRQMLTIAIWNKLNISY